MGGTRRVMNIPPAPPAPNLPDDVRGRVQALWDKATEQQKLAAQYGQGVGPSLDEEQISPREVLSRWYDNTPGGFDGAVESSQRAIKDYGTGQNTGLDWPASNADKKFVLGVFDSQIVPDIIARHVGGQYSPELHTVLLNRSSPISPRSTLDHEAAHALTMGHWQDDIRMGMRASDEGQGPFFRDAKPGATQWGLRDMVHTLRAAEAATDARFAAMLSGNLQAYRQKARPSLIEYAMERGRKSELDPYVSEIRRRYAYQTGKDVKTIEDAKEAMDWWEQSGERQWRLAGGKDAPTIDKDGQRILSAHRTLTPGAEAIMLRRMTQVPAVLGGLLGAGAASSSQEQQ